MLLDLSCCSELLIAQPNISCSVSIKTLDSICLTLAILNSESLAILIYFWGSPEPAVAKMYVYIFLKLYVQTLRK